MFNVLQYSHKVSHRVLNSKLKWLIVWYTVTKAVPVKFTQTSRLNDRNIQNC